MIKFLAGITFGMWISVALQQTARGQETIKVVEKPYTIEYHYETDVCFSESIPFVPLTPEDFKNVL